MIPMRRNVSILFNQVSVNNSNIVELKRSFQRNDKSIERTSVLKIGFIRSYSDTSALTQQNNVQNAFRSARPLFSRTQQAIVGASLNDELPTICILKEDNSERTKEKANQLSQKLQISTIIEVPNSLSNSQRIKYYSQLYKVVGKTTQATDKLRIDKLAEKAKALQDKSNNDDDAEEEFEEIVEEEELDETLTEGSVSFDFNLPSKEKFDFMLMISKNRIALKMLDKQIGGNPLFCEFEKGKADYRRKYGRDHRSPIIRAMKASGKPINEITVIDTTAGLGKDAFVLAGLGCKVQLVERNPLIYELLNDGIQRASMNEDLLPIISNMKVVNSEAVDYLKNIEEKDRPDIVYMDPMYPLKAKAKALVKKDMVMLRRLVGHETDNIAELLDVAKKVAKSCVVLKRPYYVTSDQQTSFTYRSIGTHFDVYKVTSP